MKRAPSFAVNFLRVGLPKGGGGGGGDEFDGWGSAPMRCVIDLREGKGSVRGSG